MRTALDSVATQKQRQSKSLLLVTFAILATLSLVSITHSTSIGVLGQHTVSLMQEYEDYFPVRSDAIVDFSLDDE